ncbi:MAG: hypothetical protein GQ572_00095 [Gammaproteobacteria bacterium]|nr:hypothetical protein [Gammaproteobacteria bacterium]
MNVLGIHLTLLIGPSVPVPAPLFLIESLQRVEVTHRDSSRSGFQITFQIGRSGPADLLDYQHLSSPLLRPFNRIILIVTFNATPRVLMDGIITNQQMQPGNEPGTSTLTITGEDISVMMSRVERIIKRDGQSDQIKATMILKDYPQYGLVPNVIPPLTVETPNPLEITLVQRGTDLALLQSMARCHGYVFYIVPGPVPFANTAYWGPPVREGEQRALTFNMGPDSNVTSLNFQYNSLSPVMVSGNMMDRQTKQSMPVEISKSTRTPLVSQPASTLPYIFKVLPENTQGESYMQALACTQGRIDASFDNTVTAQGELDALQYGDLLQARKLVGLRGAGHSYDGSYYVQSVTHTISSGEYKQHFTLTREGTGALSPVV